MYVTYGKPQLLQIQTHQQKYAAIFGLFILECIHKDCCELEPVQVRIKEYAQ